MKNIDLYIICAGVGSRMGGGVPKALVPITDEPCLTTTLQQIGHKFKNVFVVTNELIQDQWSEYFNDLNLNFDDLGKNVFNIPIKSGLGDGHAVLEALKANDLNDIHVSTTKKPSSIANDVVIMWGDVFIQHAEIIDELLSFNGWYESGFIPAVYKDNPYVSLQVDDNMNCISADFSKYSENNSVGFHDQSIFRFRKIELLKALQSLDACLWKGHRYITPSGELSMLYAFHYLYNNGNPAIVYETTYPTLSFNDKSEVANIQKTIKEKWHGKHVKSILS